MEGVRSDVVLAVVLGVSSAGWYWVMEGVGCGGGYYQYWRALAVMEGVGSGGGCYQYWRVLAVIEDIGSCEGC